MHMHCETMICSIDNENSLVSDPIVDRKFANYFNTIEGLGLLMYQL